MKKIKSKLILLLFCVYFFNSCSTSLDKDTILAKSSETRPNWINNKVNFYNEPTEKNITLVYKRAHIINLSLGIKQIQNYVKIRFIDIIKQLIENPEYKKSLLQSFTSPQIMAIYWEKQRNGLVDSYTIWTLLSIKQLNNNKN